MKKRKYYRILVCLVVLLFLSACSSKGLSGDADRIRIRMWHSIDPESSIISKDKDSVVVDPKAVTSLFISSPTNHDLSMLRHFVNLKYLRIDNFIERKGDKIYDLNLLKNLPLVGLSIGGFDSENPIEVSGLESLGDMKSLAILDLYFAQIEDVKDLAKLTNLSRLSIVDGPDIKIEDLSPLSKLTSLGELTDEIRDSKEWKFGPYLIPDEPTIGLLISNGNDLEELEVILEEITRNKK